MLADGWQLEELDFALNTIRASLDARLVDARVRGSFREAAEIQQSLLVEEPPAFAGYELAARSVPAEEVGGDFYDFYDLGEDTLGLAIGDASGHGLPAALLVRDVVTGLRMGIEKELKVAHVFEKLNRVIHRSRLSSRFVSVFYAELERDGNLVYVNAGHQPPMLFFRDEAPGKLSEIELSNGGTVIGPLPEARFRRGFARLHPGDVLLLLTDGILERRDKAGEFFGVESVRASVREHQAQPAETILAKLFDAALAWGDGRPWEDDATIVVLKRSAESVRLGQQLRDARFDAGDRRQAFAPEAQQRAAVRPRPAHVEDQLRRERAELERLHERVPEVDGKADRRVLQERVDLAALLADVEAQQHHALLARQALVVVRELGQLVQARLAPGGPEIEHDDLAREVGEPQRLAVEILHDERLHRDAHDLPVVHAAGRIRGRRQARNQDENERHAQDGLLVRG